MPQHNFEKLKGKASNSLKDKILEFEKQLKKANEFITLQFKLETRCGCGYHSTPYTADFPADADFSRYTDPLSGVMYLNENDVKELGGKNLRVE